LPEPIGKPLRGALVIQVLVVITQVAVAGSHRRIFLSRPGWLQPRAQFREHFCQTILFQARLLLAPPSGTTARRDLIPRRAQILADMVEVQ